MSNLGGTRVTKQRGGKGPRPAPAGSQGNPEASGGWSRFKSDRFCGDSCGGGSQPGNGEAARQRPSAWRRVCMEAGMRGWPGVGERAAWEARRGDDMREAASVQPDPSQGRTVAG